MDIVTPIDGITFRVSEDCLWLSSVEPLRVLTSAVVGDNLSQVRHVLSVRVPLSYGNCSPEGDLEAAASRLGIREPYAGLLTAVDLRTTVVLSDSDGPVTLVAAVSVGVGNATAAGSPAPGGSVPGTINIVLVVDADMTQGALVNAVITATESKTLALLAAGVRTTSGEPASGTSSDAIVVACTGRGRRLRYAGPATTVGLLIGRAVRSAVSSRLEDRS